MLKEILYLILIVLGLPVGYFLGYICPEEIKAWRGRLILMSFISLVVGIFLFFFDVQYKIPIIVTLAFIIVTCMTIVFKLKKK